MRAPVIAKLTKAQQDRLDQTWQQLVGSSKRDCTLRFFDFVVHYDGHGIVSLSVRYSGWAASPYMRVQSFNFLTGGGELQATDIFLPGTAEKLVDLLQATRDAAIAEARIGLNEEELQTFDSMLTGPGASNQSISARHFEQFVVTGQGLRFYYYFAFPVEHQAMSPSGDYLIPYADLRPYIDPGGPLGWARRKK